jgi:ABC-type nitrate/sulfonate/bicarbonate transport system permease component
LELGVPVLLIGTWWIVSADSTSLYFPSLSRILTSFGDTWLFAHLASDALPSLIHLFAGLALAVAVGVGCGLALGLSPVVADALAPPLEFARAVPAVALVPAALLLLGIGGSMQVTVIASATVWPILLNTIDGVRGVDPMISDVGRSYRIRSSDRLLRMILPAASPQIVAGMRTALSVAVTMIVFGEMVGSTNGIGYLLLQSQRGFDIPQMWASMVLLGLIGYLLNLAFRGFERLVLSWHRDMRKTSDGGR